MSPVARNAETGSIPPINLADFEDVARRQVESSAWDFVAGGSEDEITLSSNIGAFSRWRFIPRVLTGVDAPDLSVTICGTHLSSPLLVAPIGYQGLFHRDAELATVRGAAEAASVMVCSTMSNVNLETIAAETTEALWFQLYVMADRELTLSLMKRAEAAGYRALVVTVDVPRMGRRERDLRNGFSLPPDIRPGNLPEQGDPDLYRREQGISSVARHANHSFDQQLSWATIAWLKSQTRLPLLLKGVLSPEDARLAVDAGVDGIIVSNHGGRQLDGAISSLDALPGIAEAVADRCAVLLDGGLRRGTDVLKARALGACAVLIGRPILWGLIVDGANGVRGVLRLLREELEQAMVLCGQACWENVSRDILVLDIPQHRKLP